MKRFIIALATLAMTAPAWAQDSMQVGMQLGGVLAAEEFCSLTYDQEAIAAFIESKVAADDMSFAMYLKLGTAGGDMDQEAMSASNKTAYCAQQTRVAKSYGFTE